MIHRNDPPRRGRSAPRLTRREFAALGGGALLAACTKDLGLLAPLPPGAPRLLASVVPLGLTSVVLDTNNPLANFTQETATGQRIFPTPTVLIVQDLSGQDLNQLFANDPGAAAGTELDLVVTFDVSVFGQINADLGVRFVINDGQKAAYLAAIIKDGVQGLGIAGDINFADPNNYPVFVPVNWGAETTVRFRRTATGEAEIMEVNGVAPNPRALYSGVLPQGPRNFPTIEFGCSSIEAQATIDVQQLFSERPAAAVAGTIAPTHLRIRDTDSTDRLRFRADFTLGAGTNRIDPTTEPVKVTLATPLGGPFYTQTLNGFDVHGKSPRRRWSLNDSEKARTGIERLDIDEDPGNSGALFLRDIRTDLGSQDFSTVTLEVLIGDDRLTGRALLVEKPAGSGKWRLKNEP